MVPQLRTRMQWTCCGRHGLVGVIERLSISRSSTQLVNHHWKIAGRHLRQQIITVSGERSNNPGLRVGHADHVSRLSTLCRRAYHVKSFQYLVRTVLRNCRLLRRRLLDMRIGPINIGASQETQQCSCSGAQKTARLICGVGAKGNDQ